MLGRRLVFAADEYYLLAGRPFPAADAYEGFPMHEDGVGMARTFELEFTGRVTEAAGVQSGFFAWVDGAPAAGYRAPGTRRGRPGLRVEATPGPGGSAVALLPSRRAPVGVLTGHVRRRGAATAAWRRSDRDDVRVIEVAQRVLRREHRRGRPDGR